MRAPETQTLYDIFNGRIQYVVPVYQRSYVWSEEDNWRPLWDDLSEVVSHHLQNPDGEHGTSHFLGPIVLEQQHFPAGGVDQRLVIDGQQRLTTLQALLVAGSQVMRENGGADAAAELEELTVNKARVAEGDLRFKVWPSRRDRAVFQSVVDSDVEVASAEGGIPGAWRFFHERINEWLLDEEPDADEISNRIEALRVALDSLMYVVSINLDETDNAQVIFETLNARGTALTALDLAKNATFLHAERQGAPVDLLYEEHWEPTFEQGEYWQKTVSQGRLKRPRADLFLMHWLTMKLDEVVAATQLFETFRRRLLRIDDADMSVEQLIPEICSDARIMRGFDHHEPGTEEALFFQRLRAMDTTTLLPVVLWLFRTEALAPERRLRALAALESWVVRRGVLRYTAKNYNRILASLLRAAKRHPETADEAIIGVLRASDALTARWPKDDEMRDRLEHHKLYGYITQARVRMLLEACERWVRHPAKTEPIDLPTGLSIEHVLPQSWEEHWELLGNDDQEEEWDHREARVNRLGNLTLVTQPLNSSLSNAPWTADEPDAPSKREALASNSVLLLNQRLVANDHWDEAGIDKRGHVLADAIIETWPGPDADWPDSELATGESVAEPG